MVDAAGLTPVADPTNADLDYERVRWRQALPQLAALGLDARRLALFAGAHARRRPGARADGGARPSPVVALPADRRQAVIGRDLLIGLPRAVAVRVVAPRCSIASAAGGSRMRWRRSRRSPTG